MADPVTVTCLADAWTKVATDVVTGHVRKMESTPAKYLQTYRDTGEAAPTSITEGSPIFLGGVSEEISAVAGIDVYIYAMGEAGSVRVDL